MVTHPNSILLGPRGRRVCLDFAGTVAAVRQAVFDAAALHSSAAEVARLIDALAPQNADARAIFDVLASAVNSAAYWQEPSDEDLLASDPAVRRSLEPIAALLSGSASAGWWSAPVDRGSQWTAEPPGSPEGGFQSGVITETLRRWRSQVTAEEENAARDRPADPAAILSGSWWSTPPRALIRTTRALPDRGPVGLWLVEDSGGWDTAVSRPVTVSADAVVFEIDGAAAWAELCIRFPVEVTASRRHDWCRSTGVASRWIIPDWSRVAEEYDAVHLTVAGYLSTAGRAVPITDDASSVLAGWNPDRTYWLSDAFHYGRPVNAWTLTEPREWEPVPRSR